MNKAKSSSKMITKKRSLTQETESLLNDQIKMEGTSSASYLAMASWCETKGFSKSAAFLYEHSEEERKHMLKLFSYINEAGGHALYPDITGIRLQYGTFREVFEVVLDHEIAVTNSIHNLVDHCYNTKDFTTMTFLQWYVMEQREEETLARRALELFDIIGTEGMALWTLENEIGALGTAANSASIHPK